MTERTYPSIAAAEPFWKGSIGDAATDLDEAKSNALPAQLIEQDWVPSVTATVFDNANLTVARGASIIDHSALTAAKAASVFDSANLSEAKGSDIMENTNLAVAKINDIITHANIGDSRAQQIVGNTDPATRDLTGAASIYFLLDDWEDNKLTSRDDADVTATAFTDLFAQLGHFRPAWTEETAGGNVSGGKLQWDEATDGDWRLITSLTQTTGIWKSQFAYSTVGTDFDGVRILVVWEDVDNRWMFGQYDSAADELRIVKWDGGIRTKVATPAVTADTATHTQKVTRDAAGNWELFIDGTSQATTTDTFWPTENNMGIDFKSSGGGSVATQDNLEVHS